MTLHYKIAIHILYYYMKIFRRMEIRGLENIPDQGAVIFASNHISMLDPFVMGAAARNKSIAIMGKKELFFFPLGQILGAFGVFPIDRKGNATSAIRTAIKVLNDGLSMGIFPEGTRNQSNAPLLPAKRGIELIAKKTGRPVIPVAITGSRGFFSKLRIQFGKPINIKETDDLVGQTMGSIESMLMELSPALRRP
ncbi:1-acyl-sn-glycerol-3-phosphate acyltransferase [Clostridia bacterium]|nr:1-acyl-sn-glycerol-3-phosphate acyltransferase [Clostridia bacterium]